MIVVSAFNPEGCFGEPDALHKDEPFDGVDIIGMFPSEDEMVDQPSKVEEFVIQWMEDHPGHKVMIDSFSVTL